jgi:hypothetical protein
MKAAPKVVPPVDPAGLDQLLLAAARGVTRFVEVKVAQNFGRPVNLWDGPDGLGAVLDESLRNAGIPNKRLPELVTPRSILQGTRVIPSRPRRRVR